MNLSFGNKIEKQCVLRDSKDKEARFEEMENEKKKIEESNSASEGKNCKSNIVTATSDDNLKEIFHQIKASKKSVT